MRRMTPVKAESYYRRYMRLLDNNQDQRELLKQLNKEIDTRMQHRKVKLQTQTPQVDRSKIIQCEKDNNESILNRLKLELISTEKRLKQFDNCNNIEKQISEIQLSIDRLSQAILTNQKINERQGRQLSEQDSAVPPIQQEILQLYRELDECQNRNLLLSRKVHTLEKSLTSFADHKDAVDEQIQKRQSSVNLPPESEFDAVAEKLQTQIQVKEKAKKILDDKYLVDCKMIKQELQIAKVKRAQINQAISHMQVQIASWNSLSQQTQASEQPRLKYRKTGYISGYSEIGMDEDQDHQALSKSFNHQNNDSNSFIENHSDSPIVNTKYNTIVEDPEASKHHSTLQEEYQ